MSVFSSVLHKRVPVCLQRKCPQLKGKKLTPCSYGKSRNFWSSQRHCVKPRSSPLTSYGNFGVILLNFESFACFLKDVCVTDSEVQLLATQKPMQRPGWWKVKFALFRMPTTSKNGHLSKGHLPATDNQWTRAFIDRGRRIHAETSQAAPTVLLKLSSVVWPASSSLF